MFLFKKVDLLNKLFTIGPSKSSFRRNQLKKIIKKGKNEIKSQPDVRIKFILEKTM